MLIGISFKFVLKSFLQVNGIYHDESIGNIKLTLVVVRVVLLQHEVSVTNITRYYDIFVILLRLIR